MRVLKILTLALVLTVLLSCCVLAADKAPVSRDGSLSLDSASGAYTASYNEKLVSGNSYVLLVVEGAADDYTVSEETLLYINQVDDCNGTSVSFDFIPMNDENAVVLLGGQFTDNSNVRILGTIEDAGVTVSGTVQSWNSTDDAVYRLYASSVTDADIIADLKLATPAMGVAPTTRGSVSANADGKHYDQTISFDKVEPGTYKLGVFRPDGYLPEIITVTVANEALQFETIKMGLYGDVNGDGAIKTNDKTILGRFLAKWPGYEELANPNAADLNGDGSVKTTDKTILGRFIAKWPGYETLPRN